MEAVDVLYEAVRNSLEAGAGEIEVGMQVSDGRVRFTVQDNGEWNPPDNPFERGASSRADGRGMGLFLIKEADSGATLTRDGGTTRLSFSLSWPLEGLDRLSALLFSLCWSHGAHLSIECDGRRYTDREFEKRLGRLDSAGAIAAMARDIHLEHK